jgi:hypothetical protein
VRAAAAAACACHASAPAAAHAPAAPSPAAPACGAPCAPPRSWCPLGAAARRSGPLHCRRRRCRCHHPLGHRPTLKAAALAAWGRCTRTRSAHGRARVSASASKRVCVRRCDHAFACRALGRTAAARRASAACPAATCLRVRLGAVGRAPGRCNCTEQRKGGGVRRIGDATSDRARSMPASLSLRAQCETLPGGYRSCCVRAHSRARAGRTTQVVCFKAAVVYTNTHTHAHARARTHARAAAGLRERAGWVERQSLAAHKRGDGRVIQPSGAAGVRLGSQVLSTVTSDTTGMR